MQYNIGMLRRQQLGLYFDFETNTSVINSKLKPLPPSTSLQDLELIDVYENNILAASWLDEMGYKQKEFEEKITFFNNE